jgi:hypothetical protein
MVDVALQSDLDALTARVATLEGAPPPPPPPPTLIPSPSNTFVTSAAPAASIVDDALNQWFLVPAVEPKTGMQIAFIATGGEPPAVTEPNSNAVVTLGIQLVGTTRRVVQKNATGGCYYATAPGAWVAFGGPVPP